MNVADLFSQAALCCPDKKALIFGQNSCTYAEMNRIIGALARYLAGSENAPGQNSPEGIEKNLELIPREIRF
jgi:hypothetical protein